jgi:hypothetical protein
VNVTADFKAVFLSPGSAACKVPVRFTWRPRDPFAVQMNVYPFSHHPKCWLFALDLLADGVRGEVGIGDVRVAPSRSEPDRTALILRVEEAVAVLLFDTAAVEAFLAGTWCAEPRPIPDFIPFADEGAAS